MVMTMYAPDSSKSLEMYEVCIWSGVKGLGRANDFYITKILMWNWE